MIFKEGDTYLQTFSVSEHVYAGFVQLFKDKNPLHTDTQFAISKGFEGIVIHGNILNGFISYFIGECLPEKNVIIHSQEINYKNPVYLNTSLQFNAKVSGVFESVRTVEFKFTFTSSNQKVVAKGKIQIGVLN